MSKNFRLLRSVGLPTALLALTKLLLLLLTLLPLCELPALRSRLVTDLLPADLPLRTLLLGDFGIANSLGDFFTGDVLRDAFADGAAE